MTNPNRRLFFVLLCLFIYSGSFAQQPTPLVDFELSVETAEVGDTICIPVKSRNLVSVLGVGFGLRWDPGMISYAGVNTNFGVPGLDESTFGATQAESGTLRWSWVTEDFPASTTVEDDATLFEICFVALPASEGRFVSLSFDDSGLAPEVILDRNVYEVDLARTNFTPGGVFVASFEHSLRLNPDISYSLDCGGVNVLMSAGASGGVPPYRYQWSGPDVFFTNSAGIFGFIEEGIYELEVMDQDSNMVRGRFRVDFMGNEAGLPAIELSAESEDPICGESFGAIRLDVTGDPLDYDVNWSDGVDAGLIREDLPSGEYGVTVTNTESGCSESLNFELMPIGSIPVDSIEGQLDCIGDTARIGLSSSMPLEYTWNNGQTTPTIAVTSPGTYFVIVRDSFCRQQVSFEVPNLGNNPDPEDFARLTGDLSCDDPEVQIGVLYGGSSGEDFAYSWSTGDTDSVILADQRGSYTLTITGENGCATPLVFDIDQRPTAFDLLPVEEFLGCTQNQYLIGVDPANPDEFRYAWNTGDTLPLITVDAGRQYILTISRPGSDCEESMVFNPQSAVAGSASVVGVRCQTEGNCYQYTAVNLRVSQAIEPVSYILSTGDTIVAGDAVTLNINARTPVDIFVQDAGGCVQDTIRGIVAEDCVGEFGQQQLNLRQYVVCEENEETQETDTYLYNEVLGNLSVPPYVYEWSDGFQESSYFRSGRLLEATPELAITVTDRLGKSFSRNLFIPTEYYSCGVEGTAEFLASDVIVQPGSEFVYPVYIRNHAEVSRAIYTIDWDPCLLDADSIIFYNQDGSIPFLTGAVFDGTYEVFYVNDGGSNTNDSTLIAEIYFRVPEDAEGISPFLFTINEPAKNADDDIVLVRPRHGSITVANESTLVFPGDADDNGSVDNKDLLNIGLAFRAAGPDRRLQKTAEEEYGYIWGQQTPFSSIDFKNIDCNGDGIIDQADIDAIQANWNPVQQVGKGLSVLEDDIPLYLDADTLIAGRREQVPVVLGEEMMPAEDVYGVAFRISYDGSMIDPESIAVNIDDGWLTAGTTPLFLFRNDSVNQVLYLAISRTTGINVSGFGPIAEISFTTRSGVTGTARFQIEDVKMIDAAEREIGTFNRETLAVLELSTGTLNPQLQNQVNVYPNPVEDRLYIEARGLKLQRYMLFGADGRQIREGNLERPVLHTGQLKKGIYWLRLWTDQGLVVKRIVK